MRSLLSYWNTVGMIDIYYSAGKRDRGKKKKKKKKRGGQGGAEGPDAGSFYGGGGRRPPTTRANTGAPEKKVFNES